MTVPTVTVDGFSQSTHLVQLTSQDGTYSVVDMVNLGMQLPRTLVPILTSQGFSLS